MTIKNPYNVAAPEIGATMAYAVDGRRGGRPVEPSSVLSLLRQNHGAIMVSGDTRSGTIGFPPDFVPDKESIRTVLATAFRCGDNLTLE